MSGVNKAILVGNLGRDPEIRTTQSGVKVATFSIATTESYRDRDGNRQDLTEWHRIVVWRGLAEVCERYLRKGSKVYIEGRIQTRSYEDQSGQTRYTTEIVAQNMTMLDSRNSSGGMGGPPMPEEEPPMRRDTGSGSYNGGNSSNHNNQSPATNTNAQQTEANTDFGYGDNAGGGEDADDLPF